MDTETATRYLKHLDRLVAQVESLAHIHYHDVLPLRAEFRDFRLRVGRSTQLPPNLKSLLETVDLKIADELLEGSPKTKLLRVYAIFRAQSVHLQAWRAKKREAMTPEFSRLRAELRELYIALSL